MNRVEPITHHDSHTLAVTPKLPDARLNPRNRLLHVHDRLIVDDHDHNPALLVKRWCFREGAAEVGIQLARAHKSSVRRHEDEHFGQRWAV